MGAHRGAYLCRGGGGGGNVVEDIITQLLHRQTSMPPPPAPMKRGKGGVSPLLFHGILVKTHIENLWDLTPPPPSRPKFSSPVPKPSCSHRGSKCPC